MIAHAKRLNMFAVAILVAACAKEEASHSLSVDFLIANGTVFTGEEGDVGSELDIGIRDDKIVFVGDAQLENVIAETTLDAQSLIVAPGFIDPHTHALADLLSDADNVNANYLTQGVTTVFAGNDGEGPTETAATLRALAANGVGTNAALFVGHNTVRRSVIGGENRAPTEQEPDRMRALVREAMSEGALGLSSGLYYAPGSFAKTQELIELSKVAARHGGVYDSHIRDESSYSIGLLASIEEALEIGRKSGAPVHIAHIKALGVDVWGQSKDVIELIEAAQDSGQRISADQYPWSASGTRVSNALVPNWAKAGSADDMRARLRDPALASRLQSEMEKNLRKRGGAEALLIVDGDDALVGRTLREIALERDQTPVAAATAIVLEGDARVASFNMQESDIETFMKRPWVATSSDGTDGHPRKFGSFPRKYRRYVVERDVLSPSEFIRRSSGFIADVFQLCGRGYIREGFFADIVIFDPETYGEKADFAEPRRMSEGVVYLFVNGALAVDGETVAPITAGAPLKRAQCDEP